MKQPVFTGVSTALVTPFLNNQVNYPMVEQLLKRQMDSGVTSVVLSGTTGEAPTLSDHEKTELIRRAKAYTGENCQIIAGTGTNSTEHAIHMSVAAQQAGADALLVVSPYYNKGNPEGIYAHYYSIATAVDLPIILYNVPSRTGYDMPVSVYKKLSELANIIGVKEATNDITKIAKIRTNCPEDFYVWSGNDDQIVPVVSLGGKGVISVLANLCPEETLTMTEAALDGDFNTASILQCRLLPLIELLFCEVNPIPIKYAMRCAGCDCGNCRLPLGRLSQANRKRIDNFFN
jgi:4-hydroxy-tetrahydrodipicolinate synthase